MVEVSYPHIEKPEGEAARLKRKPRVRVAQIVMDYQAHGWSPEEICRQYPQLTLAEVHMAMAYYYDHPAEVDGEIAHEVEQVERDRARATPSKFLQRLANEKTPEETTTQVP